MSESVAAQFWFIIDKNISKVLSSSPLEMGIHKQKVALLTLVTWQEVVPLLANKKNHIIIVLKWTLKFRICGRHVHW